MKNFTKVVILLFLIVFSAKAFSQTSTQADTLRELMRRMDILTQEMEKKKLGEVAEKKYVSKFGMGPAASQVYYKKKAGVSIAGYGEIVYENFSNEKDDGATSGKNDQVDFLRHVLYTGYRFNDRLLFNAEIEFEHAKTGGSSNPGSVSLEFGYIEGVISKNVNVRAGMVPVPMGIINELHEPPTFMGTLRPEIERQVIPSTWRANGAGIVGEVENGLGYKLYVVEGLKAAEIDGNGNVKTSVTVKHDALNDTTINNSTILKKFSSSGIRSGRQNGAKAIAEDFALTGQVYYNGIPGLNVGASFYTGNSGQGLKSASGGEIDARTTLFSVHGTYTHQGLWLRGLYAHSSIGDVEELNTVLGLTGKNSIGESQEGYYFTAAYNVMQHLDPNSIAAILPFIQFEKVNTQKDVPAGFAKDPSKERTNLTLGLSYKPHPNIAFKADYINRDNEANSALDQFNLAVTYLF